MTYLRLLDAQFDGADWKEVARLVLCRDSHRACESHLAWAHWMTERGYRHLLRGGAPH